MNDMYDFNDEFPDNKIFKNEILLAKSGLAKPFSVYWKKQQNVTGVVGEKESRFYWNDLPQ